MVADRTRRLSLDLFVADLDDRDGLTTLIAAHAVAPARALCGMPRPAPSDDNNDMLSGAALSFGVLDMRAIWPNDRPSVAAVESFMRGYALFSTLFPQAVDSNNVAEDFFEKPGFGILERAFPLACLRWDDIEVLADGLFGADRAGLTRPRS